jgi:hypothetical protein
MECTANGPPGGKGFSAPDVTTLKNELPAAADTVAMCGGPGNQDQASTTEDGVAFRDPTQVDVFDGACLD